MHRRSGGEHHLAEDARLLPGGAFGDPDERLDCGGDVVGRNDATGGEASVAGLEPAVVGGAQPAGLVDRRMGIGIVAGREWAGEHLLAVVGDRLVEICEDGAIGVE